MSFPTSEMRRFVVRDAYAVQGWHQRGDSPEGRTLTIVGWVVENDGTWTHIASVVDNLGNYGDGIVVPNSSILESHVIIQRFGGFR